MYVCMCVACMNVMRVCFPEPLEQPSLKGQHMSSLSDLHDLVANMWTKGGDYVAPTSSATSTVYCVAYVRIVQYIYVVSFVFCGTCRIS